MLSTVCDNSQYQFLKCPTQILKWTASKKWKVPVFSLKQACQVRTGNEEENLQSILRVRMSLVLSRKTWISILTVHCWFYYHSWCFDWLWQYNELYFSWLSIYLNKYFFASIMCALYCISCLFICWNQFKKLFHKFCLCFKKCIQYGS